MRYTVTHVLFIDSIFDKIAKKLSHSSANRRGAPEKITQSGRKNRRSKSKLRVTLEVLSKKTKNTFTKNGDFTTREFTIEKKFLQTEIK